MRNLILLLALLLSAFTGNSQTIVKGTGIIYTDGVPTLSALPWADAELAIDTTNGFWYEYNRDTDTWPHAGFRIQLINDCTLPTYTPGDKQSYILLDTCNNLYRFRAGTWYAIGGGGGASDALGTGFTSGGGSGDIPASTVATMLGSFEISGGTDLTLNPAADIVVGEEGTTQNIFGPDGTGVTAGGGMRFRSGSSAGDGGNMLFISGSSSSDGNGGNVFFTAGGSDEDGNGGNFFFQSGSSVGGQAGGFNMTAADGDTGGSFTMNAGESFGGSSNGGSFSLNGGNSTFIGGYLLLKGGNAPGAVGGDIFLTPGSGSTYGKIQFTAPSGVRLIQDLSGLDTDDRTITYPNQSGTAAVITSGTAAPTTTPVSLGQIFIDTTNAKVYVSTGTSSSADWKILN